MNPDSQQINKKLLELLTQYYDDSFSRMACDYIHATGMTPQEVVALLEAMRGSKSDRSCTTVQECKELDSNSRKKNTTNVGIPLQEEDTSPIVWI